MSLYYLKKSLGIYLFNILQWINKRILKTYPLIKDCARCRDCGRNVHDFHVPDDLWVKVVNQEIVLCYDCFCDRADRKLGVKNRMTVEWE
jgi:hypothetical protein